MSIIDQAVKAIYQDECVVFPTETVYGLGANACSEKAVSKIFRYKNRPPSNPLIVHIASLDQINEITVSLSSLEKELFLRFSPGPLSLILGKKNNIPDIVTGGLDNVGVRIPDHPVALEFLKTVQKPICAPSANISGKPSPTTFEMAQFYMKDKVSVILDGGILNIGIESTVIKVIQDQIYILRSGFVTPEMIFDTVGIKPIMSNSTLKHQSPGTQFPHYKPKATIKLFEDIHEITHINKKDSLVLHLSDFDWDGNHKYFSSVISYAHDLYAVFFESDKQNISTIYCELPPDDHQGIAL
ncbi:MAG: L-threonylcarbamoyladenylate synthase, partial [Brevinema sp.]